MSITENTCLIRDDELLQSISSFKLNDFYLELPIDERDFIHLFDIHCTQHDSNAGENSEAYLNDQYVLLPESKSTYCLCVLTSHNYFGWESVSNPIISINADQAANDLVKEIKQAIQNS